MAKHMFVFQCPCCHKDIEFDTRSRTARAVNLEDIQKAQGGKNLDRLVADQKHEGERLADTFGQAADAVKGDTERLDSLFSDALDQAKKEPNKKPPNPFDLE